MKNRRLVLIGMAVALCAGMQTFAQGEKNVAAIMSNISAAIATSKANVAATAGKDGAAGASAIDTAVKNAANAALTIYNTLLNDIAAGETDAAAATFAKLQAAEQAVNDALAGKVVADTDQGSARSVVQTTDSLNTAGSSKSAGDTNVEISLSDPNFIQKFKQKEASIFQRSQAFGGDKLGYNFATPE